MSIKIRSYRGPEQRLGHIKLITPILSLPFCVHRFTINLLSMEPLVSAVVSDLLSRALSMVIHKYRQPRGAEQKLQLLQRVLLRIGAMVEEAEGRHITNQAMLQQLEMLRQHMYEGHYMLDSFRYRGHGGDDEVSGGRRPATMSRLRSARHLLFLSSPRRNTENQQNTELDAESVKSLEKMLAGLETMVGDMEEFTVFLVGYPRIYRQPYNAYLVLDKVMFGRQMEKERIINFLLQPSAPTSDQNHGVLPIIGPTRVGKSTLVEHVCLDERVRRHFASIVLFTGDDLGAGNLAALSSSGVVKHQDLTAPSYGRSLAIIELSGDMDEETWGSLYTSAANNMRHGSKIIITSPSDKIAALGTTHALKLKLLTQEAYWYFFKVLAFGTISPNDQRKLASMGMEIAVLLNGSFLGAHIVGSLMSANLNAQFWYEVLQGMRDYKSKHLIMFGEHPNDLIYKDRRVYLWRTTRSEHVVEVSKVYQERSSGQDVPKITAQDVLSGQVTHQGKFTILGWRSNIPPYHTYLASCTSQTIGSVDSKKRPRQERG
ncbi:hypothetical protein ACP4OV_024556 [Aristida adscensionis]